MQILLHRERGYFSSTDRIQGGPVDEGREQGLSFFTTEQLVEELKKRSDGCVVAYVRADSPANNDDRYGFYFGGSATTICGLVARMAIQIAFMEWGQMQDMADCQGEDEENDE